VAGDTHLKTSPNLSPTTIVRPERVNAICVGFFGISLRVFIVSVVEKKSRMKRGSAPLAQELQAVDCPDFDPFVVAGCG
jgi:hypothetical protein